MFFIAEIGMNHNGNFDLAYELIRQAKYAGADSAKFQCGWRDKKGELNCIDIEILKKLKKWCDYFDIEFMASVITEEAYAMVKQVEPRRYKIASRTVRDKYEFARRVVEENPDTIVSLGMWDKSGVPFKNDTVQYLWCRSLYPAFPEDIVDMPKDFAETDYAGYSDHTIGIEACLIAIARGAEIIEKHFTLDKSSTVIRDHVLSATPDEFAELTRLGRVMNKNVSLSCKAK